MASRPQQPHVPWFHMSVGALGTFGSIFLSLPTFCKSVFEFLFTVIGTDLEIIASGMDEIYFSPITADTACAFMPSTHLSSFACAEDEQTRSRQASQR